MINYPLFYPLSIQRALQNEEPGSWIPKLPADCIRLSAGYPAPALVPSVQLGDATQRVLREEQDKPLQYVGSPRMAFLRKWVRERLEARGLVREADGLLLTSGGVQAIDLMARILLDSNAVVVVEAPTYMEALEIFRNYTNRIVAIPVDDEGLQTDALESFLHSRRHAGLPLPRLLYTIPSFHNPTGVTLTLERRQRLLELAEQYDFLILEDDAYGELAFAAAPKPLKQLDVEGRVIHVGSLSKVVAPGLRIGWVVGPTPLVSAMEWFKKDLDHAFVEATAASYLAQANWSEHLGRLQNAYEERRDIMLQALQSRMPGGVTWTQPTGGYFVWLTLPGLDTATLLPQALEAGVSYIPGRYFFHQPEDGKEHLRLSYSYVEANMLVAGVERLASLIQNSMAILR